MDPMGETESVGTKGVLVGYLGIGERQLSQ